MRKLIFGRKYVQPADLNNSLFINNIASPVVMNGKVTRTTDHKGGNTAIQFGSGNLVSINNLPTSPVWSVSFWMKTNSTSPANILLEFGNDYNAPNSFLIVYNTSPWASDSSNKLSARMSLNAEKISFNNISINDNIWRHFVIILDTTQPNSSEIKIYVNKILNYTNTSKNGENTSNFRSDKVYIGGRGTTYGNPLIGATSPIKMFNYALTQTEIDNLYNE